MQDDIRDPEAATRQARAAAGQDPSKRAQILEGARQIIGQMGFDAASVSDIARAAGVSKGTIYVYFANKEELFEALMEMARDSLFEQIEQELTQPGPLIERLTNYGMLLCRTLCSDEVIRAHRVILGVTERMPDFGQRFYQGAVTRGMGLLRRTLEQEVEAHRLDIADIPLATAQFSDLCTSTLFKRRLFGHLERPPTEEEIARVVNGAVSMFLTRYGVQQPYR